MVATPERTYEYSPYADEAIKRINEHLGDIDERFALEELEREFAFCVRRLGKSGLFLADTTQNPVGTFKLRGALNKMAKEQAMGETAARLASQGNHLLGGVYASKLLDMNLDGYVPTNVASQKLQKARALQPDTSRLRLHQVGTTLEESVEAALRNEHGVFVHPFDDPDVVAGQGTIADDVLEKARQLGIALKHVVVPIGGGGLAAGVASRFHDLDPDVMVHGVESQGNNSLSRSLEAGQRTEILVPNPRYGGATVKKTGEIALRYFEESPNVQIWKVSDAMVERVAEEYLDERQQRNLDYPPLEPTSLVAIAALEKIVRYHPDQATAVIGTGRNAPIEDIWNI